MQRGGSLHRDTPLPGLESSSARNSGSLTLNHLSMGTVESIQESEEEDSFIRDSAGSLMDSKAWSSGNGKSKGLSPIISGKLYGTGHPKGGSRRAFSNSGQSSPTGSQDSQGSGTTMRSVESLHRPTPIPSDASGSFAGGGSFMRRTSGRAQPQTPTISEFEGDDAAEGVGSPVDLASLPDLLKRNQSLGERSVGSLHRATPVPTDLLSTSGSGSRLFAQRSATPTIREDEQDRVERSLQRASGESMRSTGSLHRDTPMPQDLTRTSAHSVGHSTHPVTPTICEEEELAESRSDLDSNEHYYGRPERLDSAELPPAAARTVRAGSASASPAPSRPRSQRREAQPQGARRDEASGKEGTAAALAPKQVDSPALPSVAPGSGVSPSTSGKMLASGASPPSPYSPFVDSKDWERDILGVARFLRMCPGLSRQIIGDLLGENNERCLRVLECFTASFDFTGLPFEAALREYLESFRLPGESQKIYRILESWSRQFHRQCPGIFRTSDAVLVLAFSLVLLNTDRHKSTVKKKMTCEEFVRNNKGVNDGQDFPTDFLEELYRNIERRAIRIPPAHPADNLLHHNSLPEPIRATKKQYESPQRARPTGWLCF